MAYSILAKRKSCFTARVCFFTATSTLLLISVGAVEPKPETQQKTTETQPSIPTKGGQLEFHERLSDEFANLDPGETGWESEAFNEAAGARMKLLSKKLLHPKDIDSSLLVPLISKGFACGDLRPAHRRVLFESPAIRVAEDKSAGGGALPVPQAGSHKGAEGFAFALKEMVSDFEGATDLRAKFKIMGVELKNDRVATKMLFEMRGQQESGWRQIHSNWHCVWTKETPPLLLSISVSDYREVSPGAKGRLDFVDAAPSVLGHLPAYREQLAKSFDYWRSRSDRSLVADLLGAQGVVVGDVNGDDRDDIYVLQPGGLPNRLFVHQEDGTARDISLGSGVDVLDFCRSALLVDLDNDGDRDLALGMAWKLFLFENDGTGKFTPRGGHESNGQINSMAAADYDGDGDLDLFICGRDASGEMKSQQGALGIPMPYYDANNGGPNALFRNDLDGKSGTAFTFKEVTREAGLDVNNRRFSLACAWEDFDNDGDQDLYVSNDFGRNNLWRNDGPGEDGIVRFQDIAEQAGVVDIGPGMSAAWGDYNNDGHMDIYVANMWSNAGNRITLQKQFLPGADESIKKQARRHARGNSVYLNDGKGAFHDITRVSGANMARWAWSSNFIDINNDGYQDLVVANGMISTADTGDL